jgi:hypothetical protein
MRHRGSFRTAADATADPCAASPPVTGAFCADSDYPWDGWTNYGHAYAAVGFFADRLGLVHLEGMAMRTPPLASTPHSPIFVLPAGYRPRTERVFEAACSRDGSTDDECRVDVAPDGRVSVVAPWVVGSGWVSLDGIDFRVSD